MSAGSPPAESARSSKYVAQFLEGPLSDSQKILLHTEHLLDGRTLLSSVLLQRAEDGLRLPLHGLAVLSEEAQDVGGRH